MIDNKIFALEGLNGSGKTTAYRYLRDSLSIKTTRFEHIPPKHGPWADIFGQLLFSEKLARRSDVFFVYVSCYMSEIERIKISHPSFSVILDRSIFSTLAYFSNLPISDRLGILKYCRIPGTVFFITANAATVEARLKIRGESSEQQRFNEFFQAGYEEIFPHLHNLGVRILEFATDDVASPEIAMKMADEMHQR